MLAVAIIAFFISNGEQELNDIKTEVLPPADNCNVNQDTEIYLYRNDKKDGPYSPVQIKNMWLAGNITMDTPVWHSKLADKMPVSELVSKDPFFKNENSPLSSIDSRLKWIGFALGGFMIWIITRGCEGSH